MFRLIQKFAIATIVFLVLFVAVTKLANAQMTGQGMMGSQTGEVESSDELHESLDEVLAELLEKYSKDTVQELSCNELTDSDFERLGDAVMESMHPGEAHERMDEMMGGEGSESLRLMHIQMGQRYLGCNTLGSVKSLGMMPVVGMMSGWSMMDSSSGGPLVSGLRTKFWGAHYVLAIITWIAFTAFLIAGARWFWKKAGK